MRGIVLGVFVNLLIFIAFTPPLLGQGSPITVSGTIGYFHPDRPLVHIGRPAGTTLDPYELYLTPGLVGGVEVVWHPPVPLLSLRTGLSYTATSDIARRERRFDEVARESYMHVLSEVSGGKAAWELDVMIRTPAIRSVRGFALVGGGMLWYMVDGEELTPDEYAHLEPGLISPTFHAGLGVSIPILGRLWTLTGGYHHSRYDSVPVQLTYPGFPEKDRVVDGFTLKNDFDVTLGVELLAF